MRKKNIPTLIGLLIILIGTLSGVYLIEQYKTTKLFAQNTQEQEFKKEYVPDAYIVLTNNKKVFPNEERYKNIKSEEQTFETQKAIAYEIANGPELLSFISSHLTIIFVFSTISLAVFIFLGLFVI